MSEGKSGVSASRRTRGKGRRKAGRGPDPDMDDGGSSDHYQAAQSTVSEFSKSEGERDSKWRPPGGSTSRSRERRATRGVVYGSSRAVMAGYREVDRAADDEIDRTLEFAREWLEGEDNE